MRTLSKRSWGRVAVVVAVLSVVTLSANRVAAQEEPENGPRTNLPRVHALINARIVAAPGEVIEKGTVVIRNGVIDYVGPEMKVPADARVWDLQGKTIHAGFIDASVPVESPTSLPASEALHWNDKVRSQFSALEAARLSQGDVEALRKIGFTAAQIVPNRGVFRGSAATVALVDSSEDEWVYDRHGPCVVTFESGGWGSGYPSVLIGVVALIRQTFYDTQWFSQCWDMYRGNPFGLEPPAPNDALAALRDVIDARQRPVWIETSDEFDLFRAKQLEREFQINVIVRGSGEEFRRLGDVLETNLPIVLPLRFPDRPEIESAEDADNLTLRTMMEWEQAPTNARRLMHGGAMVALTTDLLDDRGDFLKNLRTAMEEGVSEDEALAALTITPARLLGLQMQLGRVERGLAANLVVIDGQGALFDKDRTVDSVWVNGQRHEIKKEPVVTADGKWTMTIEDAPEGTEASLVISGQKDGKPKVVLHVGQEKYDGTSVELRVERLSFIAPGKAFGRTGWEQWTGVITGEVMRGQVRDAQGNIHAFTAQHGPADEKEEAAKEGENEAAEAKDDQVEENQEAEPPPDQAGEDQEAEQPEGQGKKEEEPEEIEHAPEQYPVPLGAYGMLEPPKSPGTVLIRNATVWTSADAGILEGTDVLIKDGKFAAIGKSLEAPQGAMVIDATGKAVTAGLIDAHSHTGIERGSINEGSQAISAETRIVDAIDPDDISWYRQLAGGLTAANQLHGSANPMGGQNSVVRIRWGENRNAFVFDTARPGIKFALGENVKRPNSNANPPRYPRTRMGVESLMRSEFLAAQDYAQKWDRWNKGIGTEERAYPPRRDLELDTIAEILAGTRDVHCHSYRQDEILMLLKLADDFHFRVAVLQHILEGYKVASEIAARGTGASTFSDWWAYKIEVYDAIPYNGTIMNRAGVVVSFNSDSDELARRLNTEATKAVRYGGLDPAEALKFVTINPAVQLGIDDRVGSVEVGKDADFVIWSGDPLSTLSRCEQTWIMGIAYFTLERDAQLRATAKSERQRLIQKILRQAHKDPDKAQEEKKDRPMNQRARRPQQVENPNCWTWGTEGGEP